MEFFKGILHWYRSRSWLGRRVVLISAALGLSWVVTGTLIWMLIRYEVADHHEVIVGALVAFAGELIFFSIVGGVVTILTLKDPAQASFEERVRILYGADNLPEAVTEYNKRMISRLAGYAQKGTRQIWLEQYRADIKAYRVKVRTEYYYRNLLPDVEYEATLPWRFRPDKIEADPPVELGRVISIKIGDRETVYEPIIVDERGFNTELPLHMPRKGETIVVFEYFTWMLVGESQTLHPRRFVEQFSMTIVNQATQSPAAMLLEGQANAIQLLFNQNFPFKAVQSVAPDEKIFGFSLLAPQ